MPDAIRSAETPVIRDAERETLKGRAAAAIDRLFDALTDPARRERTAVLMLAGYCVVWTLYATLAKSSQDIHFDMGEMVAWSREIALGTPKHPPLPAWLVWAWFWVFPLSAWAYYLLAMANAAVALWIAWAASAPYLDARKRAVGLALLTFVPFFNFHALKFNANSAMMPWWGLTTWFFLRSFETRRPGIAALAGIAAAGAMLVKYWSIVLLLGIAIAALLDPRRRQYFASPAPYITVAAGALALSPHIGWLVVNQFAPFRYALESHPATIVQAIVSGLGYMAGALGYVAGPILAVAIAARPSGAAIRDMLLPGDASRRLAMWVFVLPLMLPVVAAVMSAEQVVSLWAIAGATLVPVVLLSAREIAISRVAALWILGIAVAVPFGAVLVAPGIALITHFTGVPNYGNHYSLVAREAEKVWGETTDEPLRLVGSYNNLLYGSVFYFTQHPSTYEIVDSYASPWVNEERIAREGVLLYCPVAQNLCMDALTRRAGAAPQARRVEVDISRRFLGFAGPRVRYAIAAIPPR